MQAAAERPHDFCFEAIQDKCPRCDASILFVYVVDLDNMQLRMFHESMSGISYPLLNIPEDWEDPEIINFIKNKIYVSKVDRLKSALQSGVWHVNAATEEGVTGLIRVSRAIYNADNFATLARTVEVLLEAGADLEACNAAGTTSLSFNVAADRTEAVEVHYALAMANYLLQNGASVGLLHLLRATDACCLRPLLHANPGALLQALVEEPSDWEISLIGHTAAKRYHSTLDQLTSVIKRSPQITPLQKTLTVLLFASGALLSQTQTTMSQY
jgi:hypothetical protein